MIRRPPRSTHCISSAASDVYKRQAQDTSGTPGYMAPEVMCRQNHGVVADYFALGVIAYECMLGRRPYQGRSRREIRDQVLARQAMIKLQDLPQGWSVDAADFINLVLFLSPIAAAAQTFVSSRPQRSLRSQKPSVAARHFLGRHVWT
eukprot:TRINITY_DN4556_c0_g2_i8.p1 TRINITY_DN4556_c0_g2~~TRINITY_DN4556_c0_g2_i8.p1  ORF type:complete len:160 (-),score=42.37 TRINITY_DN4556_c0_g2_i8:170-613(-)